jgi:hypothetical protein
MSVSLSGLQRKVGESNPVQPSRGGCLASSFLSQFGYLPFVSVDPPGIEPESPACRAGVLPLDDEPIVVASLQPLAITYLAFVFRLESSRCVAQPPMLRTHLASHAPATFSSSLSSTSHSGPPGNRTPIAWVQTKRLPVGPAARVFERSAVGLEPGLRPYHGRVLPEHLQTVTSVIPGGVEPPLSWLSPRCLRHWTTGSFLRVVG